MVKSEGQLSRKPTFKIDRLTSALGTQRTLNERVYKDKFQYTSQKKGLGAISSKLRNFGLTVEEIRIVGMIKELIENLDRLSFDDPHSPKWVKYKLQLTRSQSRPI